MGRPAASRPAKFRACGASCWGRPLRGHYYYYYFALETHYYYYFALEIHYYYYLHSQNRYYYYIITMTRAQALQQALWPIDVRERADSLMVSDPRLKATRQQSRS